MKTYCLVIDDDNQEEYFNANVQRILKSEGTEIIPFFIKPTERKYMKSDFSGLDKNAIINDCRSVLDAYNVSIIVSDYNIATESDSFTGVDIVLALIETHPNIYKILYSATIKNAIKQVLTLLPSKSIATDIELEKAIENLARIAQIGDFVSGKGYEQKVIQYLRKPLVQCKQHLINILKESAPDIIFKSCYPPFSGKTLKEIGIEIEKGSPQGREFQEELIRQTLAYLITVNNE